MTITLVHPYPDIASLAEIIEQLRTRGDGAQRDLLIKRVFRLTEPLNDEMKRLETKLDVGMTWLGENETHQDHSKREELWFRWEERYRAIVDVLEAARKAMSIRAP